MNRAHPPVEAVILDRGRRGMGTLARHLPADYCARAAQAIWERRQRTLITTGFHVSGRPENDGPLGALFLGRALARCGGQVVYTAEDDTLALLEALAEPLWGQPGPRAELEPFPILDAEASARHAEKLLTEVRPSLLVAIERCGRTRRGRYLNMRGKDISPFTAQVDELFTASGAVTVCIGDGGNEIGMGALATEIAAELGIEEPAVTRTDYLVVATVSNWGTYGLLAYLSLLSGLDLVPTEEEEATALNLLVENGCVSGITGVCEPIVDGFPLEVDQQVIRELRAITGAWTRSEVG